MNLFHASNDTTKNLLQRVFNCFKPSTVARTMLRWSVRTKWFRCYICHTCLLILTTLWQHRQHFNSEPYSLVSTIPWLHQIEGFVRNCCANHWYFNQVFFRIFNCLANGFWYFYELYQYQKPTRPLRSPTTTRAAKRRRRPPLTTLVTRLTATRSSSSAALSFKCHFSSVLY